MNRDVHHAPASPARILAALPWPLLALGLGLPVCQAVAQTAPSLAAIGQVTLDASYAAWPANGIAAGFQLPGTGGQTWLGVAGYRDLQQTMPLLPTDQFRVGSQSKTYTGTLVLQMVSQGSISLDQTVASILPASGLNNAGQITVRQLLSMTSGIPDYLNAPSATQSGQTVLGEWNAAIGQTTSYTPAGLVARANALTAAGLPGAAMNYSNTNFVVLGMIAEKVGGAPIGTLIQNRILTPLGLTGTRFTTNDQFTGAFAHGYLLGVDPATSASKSFGLTTSVTPGSSGQQIGTAVDFAHVQPQVPWAAGAIVSTPGDELQWIREITSNAANLLSAPVQARRVDVAAALPGTVANFPALYGLAIYVQPNPLTGAPLLGHGGLITGYNSDIVVDQSTGVAYVANVAGFDDANAPLAQSPALVWMLSRNIGTATTAGGNCTSGSNDQLAAGGSCAGVNVRTGSLSVTGGTLAISASGQSYGGYQPSGDGRSQVAAPTPVPSIAFYGDGMTGLSLAGGAAAVIQPGGLVTMTGANSTAVALAGQGGSLTVAGEVSTATIFAVQVGSPTVAGAAFSLPMAATPGTVAVRLTGTGNTLTITPTGQVTGDVVIGTGGNLVTGQGAITGLLANTAGSVVAPGTAGSGVLTVGTYRGNGGTLRIVIGRDGGVPVLSVLGTAVLSGDVLEIVRPRGAPDALQPAALPIAGAVNGVFASVIAPAGVAIGTNGQIATVSPGVLDVATELATRSARYQRDAVNARLGGFTGGAAANQTRALIGDGRGTVWVSEIGGIGGGTARATGVAYEMTGSGVVLGVDGHAAPEIVVGVSFSHFVANASVAGNGGKAGSISDNGSVYGGWFHAPFFVTANFMGGHGTTSATRQVNVAGTMTPQPGSGGDTRLGGGVRAGIAVDLGGYQLVPELGLSYDHVIFDRTTERAATPLSVDRHAAGAMRAEARVSVSRELPIWNGLLTAGGHAGIAHDWSPGAGRTTATLPGFAAPFVLDVRPRGGTMALLGAGIRYRALPSLSLFLAYDGEFGEAGTGNLFSGGARLAF